jgi:hypothetical protein
MKNSKNSAQICAFIKTGRETKIEEVVEVDEEED